MKDARNVVRKALITEKGTVLREVRNQYHFEVARDANKIEIKRAIETIFHVKVADVRTMQVRADRMQAGIDPAMLATDLTDHLVALGMPFREAHGLAGKAVRRAADLDVKSLRLHGCPHGFHISLRHR